MTRNHFTVLGLKPGATDDDVKKAYRSLAKKFHPDKNKAADAEEKFKEVAAAYDALKHKDRREIYERELNRQKEGFVKTEFRPPGGKTFESNYKTKEEYYERRRSEPPPKFTFEDEPFTGPYSQYRNSKGFKEKEFYDGHKPKAAGRKRPQRKAKWNNNWNAEEDMNFHDNGDKSSFSFAFKSFMDDMDFTMSFTLDGDQGFTSFFGDVDPFTQFFGQGPRPQKQYVPNPQHRKNVAGEHGYNGGLDEDYLFTPRSGVDSDSGTDSSDDSDFDYSDMRFTCAFCGKRLKLEDLKTHEPACGQRNKKNVNIGDDDDKEKNGYKKMFQEKTGDWRRDHERFQEYVKRAKRAYRIRKSGDYNRMETNKLLCRICGKVIERGEAQTHSLFCYLKDPHFGPPPTNSEDPPMKDSKFKRAKEYAKKKVPKFKKSFSADDQSQNFKEPKTKGRDTVDEPMPNSGTGLNATSPKSKFGKTKRAPAPPPPQPGPGPTVGPAPTVTSPKSEETPKSKAGQKSSNLPPGQRSSYPPGPQSNQASSPQQQQSPQRPGSTSVISRQEDVGPRKVGSYQYVRTRYIIATKNPNYSESESSSSDEETDSENEQQPRVVIRPRPPSGQQHPPNIKIGQPPQNLKSEPQPQKPTTPEKNKKFFSFGKKK